MFISLFSKNILVNFKVARLRPNFVKILKKTINEIAEVSTPKVFLSVR